MSCSFPRKNRPPRGGLAPVRVLQHPPRLPLSSSRPQPTTLLLPPYRINQTHSFLVRTIFKPFCAGIRAVLNWIHRLLGADHGHFEKESSYRPSVVNPHPTRTPHATYSPCSKRAL